MAKGRNKNLSNVVDNISLKQRQYVDIIKNNMISVDDEERLIDYITDLNTKLIESRISEKSLQRIISSETNLSSDMYNNLYIKYYNEEIEKIDNEDDN